MLIVDEFLSFPYGAGIVFQAPPPPSPLLNSQTIRAKTSGFLTSASSQMRDLIHTSCRRRIG